MRPVPTVSTIFPTCALDSISSCARAASASGNVAWITGLMRPASMSGQIFSSRSRATSPLKATGRGRSVPPVIVRRRRRIWSKETSPLPPAEQGEDHDAPVVGQRADVALHVVAGHHVEDHVGAPAAGEGLHLGDEVLRPVVDGAIGAQRLAGAALLVAAGGDEHAVAQGAGHLDGRDADAARAPVHQQHLARRQPPAAPHHAPDGEERLRERRALRHREPAGNRQALLRGRGAVLRVAAARHQRADLVAHAPLRHRTVHRDDPPGDLEPRDVGGARRHRIVAAPLQHVGAVHAGGGDGDEHLAGAGRGHRPRAGLQHLRDRRTT